jgi:hypothetical protein
MQRHALWRRPPLPLPCVVVLGAGEPRSWASTCGGRVSEMGTVVLPSADDSRSTAPSAVLPLRTSWTAKRRKGHKLKCIRHQVASTSSLCHVILWCSPSSVLLMWVAAQKSLGRTLAWAAAICSAAVGTASVGAANACRSLSLPAPCPRRRDSTEASGNRGSTAGCKYHTPRGSASNPAHSHSSTIIIVKRTRYFVCFIGHVDMSKPYLRCCSCVLEWPA